MANINRQWMLWFDINSDLPELVDTVSQIPEKFMRVGMMNPMYMPRIREGLLKSFESSKVFKFLHASSKWK